MTCSYVEGNVPKLIVRDIFRNIPRFYYDIKIETQTGSDPPISFARCEYSTKLTNQVKQ
jgi:hypothetical protein